MEVLNAIYEADFKGFSYGFRPKRGQHQALDALATGIIRTPMNWIIDADIRAFFDSVNHDWLMRFIEHRVGDVRLLRLIRKWLTAGVMQNAQVLPTTTGTPQGAVISPLLANIYLHYVYDLWADRWRQRSAHGRVTIVRYADDTVVGFQHRADATGFLTQLRERLDAFSLSLHPDKTGASSSGASRSEIEACKVFRQSVIKAWLWTLRRRSQRQRTTWKHMAGIEILAVLRQAIEAKPSRPASLYVRGTA